MKKVNDKGRQYFVKVHKLFDNANAEEKRNFYNGKDPRLINFLEKALEYNFPFAYFAVSAWKETDNMFCYEKGTLLGDESCLETLIEIYNDENNKVGQYLSYEYNQLKEKGFINDY